MASARAGFGRPSRSSSKDIPAETIELVAPRVGVPGPENRYEQGPDRKERDEMLALLDAATEHFAHNLWMAPGTRAREYLLGRGFKKETLERIRAGAAA